jgi:hypothetical protein
MDPFEVDEMNHEILEKFLGRVRKGEVIAGIVTVNPRDPGLVIWYPVDQDRSNALLDGLAKIERL